MSEEIGQGGQPTRLDHASRGVAESAAEVGALREAVRSVNLRFDPAAAEELRAMLDEHLGKVDGWLNRVGGLARHAPLGQNPVGTAMAAKFANRADGAESSFAEVLRGYRDVLRETRDAVDESLRTYREIDDSAAERLRGLIR